jgi:hypothetical protein
VVSFSPRPLYPGERDPGTHWIGWVGPGAGPDTVEKILDPTRLEILPLGRVARSQSLYKRHCPGSYLHPILYRYSWKEWNFSEETRSHFITFPCQISHCKAIFKDEHIMWVINVHRIWNIMVWYTKYNCVCCCQVYHKEHQTLLQTENFYEILLFTLLNQWVQSWHDISGILRLYYFQNWKSLNSSRYIWTKSSSDLCISSTT